MAILPAMQDAARMLVGKRPDVFFGSTGNFENEICVLINEVAEDIAQYRDWQALVRIANVAAGSGLEVDLPADYSRMMLNSELQSSTAWLWGYSRYEDINAFLFDENMGHIPFPPGGWIIYDDKLRFFPQPVGNTVFPYISKHWARRANAGGTGDQFIADSDSFVLPERLLKLGLIWRWREMKKLDYTGDMEAFTKALDEYGAKDGGSRIQRYGGNRWRAGLNVGVAWPGGWR